MGADDVKLTIRLLLAPKLRTLEASSASRVRFHSVIYMFRDLPFPLLCKKKNIIYDSNLFPLTLSIFRSDNVFRPETM
jgi:hypothetical protein